MSVDKAMGDTLALVNSVLLSYGKEQLTDLPRARPGHSSDCLYARALRPIGVTSVGGGGEMSFVSDRVAAYVAGVWGTVADGNTVVPPKQFGNVIGQFDGNELAAYEDRS